MTGTIEPVQRAWTVAMHEMDVDDPFANEHRPRIERRVRELEAMASAHYDGVPGIRRTRRARPDRSNPATAALIGHDPTIADWLATVPTAAALHPLYNPDVDRLPSGVRLGEETRNWIRNLADGRGIRSRAHVLDALLVAEAANSRSAQRWLSLACGAAQPVLIAAATAASRGTRTPLVTLADLDKQALRLAQSYAEGHGVAAQTTVVRTNVLQPEGFGHRSARPGRRSPDSWVEAFDVVDAVGILEYLRAPDWRYHYRGVMRSGRTLAGTMTFLRNAFACVRPGGLLVVGNMLDSHPQLGFTLDVVQWPHIQPRGVETMLEMFRDAGLQGQIDVYLPSDGVYAVYAIRKPV